MAHLRTGGAVTPISCSATGSTRSINRRPIRLPISASDLQHSSLLHGKQDCPGKTKPSSEPLQLSPSPVAKQWERVPEGRVRALCRSGGKTVDLSHGDHRSQAPRSSPPVAPEPDTSRSTALVGTPREKASELQVRSSMSDRPIHCRFSLPRRPPHHRARWRDAFARSGDCLRSRRTVYLKAQGFRIVRVMNDDVYRRFDDVMDMILLALEGKLPEA